MHNLFLVTALVCLGYIVMELVNQNPPDKVFWFALFSIVWTMILWWQGRKKMQP